eukprot:6566313-Alexandrium_andersonii.AAC.1
MCIRDSSRVRSVKRRAVAAVHLLSVAASMRPFPPPARELRSACSSIARCVEFVIVVLRRVA